MKKKCNKCKFKKGLGEFCKDKSTHDGLCRCCRSCRKAYGKEYSSEERTDHQQIGEKIKERSCEYRQKLRNRKDEDILIAQRKKCSKCGEDKPAENFDKDRSAVSGLRSRCKGCCKEQRYQRRERTKKYYNDHKKERAEYHKEYRQKNRERIKEESEKYYLKNKDKCKKYQHEYFKTNKDWIKKRHQKYQKEHKKEISMHICDRKRKDLNFKILCNLRGRLYDALKSQNTKKANHTIKLIGCSVDFLRSYLEAKFLSLMTWDNYGGKRGWWMDHIKPCAAFDLTDPEQQKECFHYSNLQPLWAKDNMRKNSKHKGKIIRRYKGTKGLIKNYAK